jgi:hypothetical protein
VPSARTFLTVLLFLAASFDDPVDRPLDDGAGIIRSGPLTAEYSVECEAIVAGLIGAEVIRWRRYLAGLRQGAQPLHSHAYVCGGSVRVQPARLVAAEWLLPYHRAGAPTGAVFWWSRA